MTQRIYPPTQTIQPLTQSPRATVRVPGSKSITNRALLLAALCGDCTLHGVSAGEDIEVMVECLRTLGFVVDCDWNTGQAQIRRPPGARRIPVAQADLFVANSGTTMRFLTASLALGHGRYRLDGIERMRQRPIRDLLDALTQLGVSGRSENNNGCPPVVVEANGLPGGTARIRGDVSSQFLSGLLLAAPFADGPLTIEVESTLVSVPYVTMTVELLRSFGAVVETTGNRFVVPAPQRLQRAEYRIEPDASAASYFFAAAAITGGRCTVVDLPAKSLQGDVRFVELLAQMGCRVERTNDGITVEGSETLHGIDVDMNDISDTVMTLAAVACFATGATTIRNVAHIRHKETDRLAALAVELRRLGGTVLERADGLVIEPSLLHGATVQTYNDHRMAMSLALIGLKIPGVVIDNPACVSKTYPGFFDDLERLRK